jgi:hypothetical protein
MIGASDVVNRLWHTGFPQPTSMIRILTYDIQFFMKKDSFVIRTTEVATEVQQRYARMHVVEVRVNVSNTSVDNVENFVYIWHGHVVRR